MNVIFILSSVASIWSVAVMTPGPNFFVTAQVTVKHSSISGLFIVLGTCTGTVIWSTAGYFGIAYLFVIAPWIYTTLKIIGGSYIIYLGTKLIINAYKSNASTTLQIEDSQSNYLNWWKGLITNLSNPKTAMFITSLFASVLPKEPTIFIGISIVITMVLISLLWYSFIVVIFSSARFNHYYNRVQNWIEGIAGVIFVGFGAKLVFGKK